MPIFVQQKERFLIMDFVHVENGDLNISFANAMHFADAYGKILAVIHAIAPYQAIDETTKQPKKYVQHMTQIFYSKGFVHTAMGFMIGFEEGLSTDRLYRVIGLKTITDMIPSSPTILHDQELMDNGLGEIKENLFFIIRIPEEAHIPNTKKSKGQYSFEMALAILQDQGEKITFIGENNDVES